VAVTNVKKIFDGARAFYEAQRKFPESVDSSPKIGACCDQPDHTCKPDPSLWKNPSWQALKFSVDGPDHYSYSFDSTGAGPDAVFAAHVFGDLDCDGTYSTFEMVGSIDSQGAVAGGTGIFKDNELE
jgi:hypothetical protein